MQLCSRGGSVGQGCVACAAAGCHSLSHAPILLCVCLLQIEACTADILLQVHLADSDGSGPSRLEQQQVAQQEQQPRGEELREQQPASEAQEEQPSQQPEGAAADAPLLQQEQEEQPGQQMEPQETGATPAEQQQPEQQPEQQHGQPEAAAVAAAMEQPEQQPSQQSPQQPQQQEAEPPGRFLRAFLAYLIAKNHGAMRHIPPPGLSDQTCLVSTAFALLRLMNDQVCSCCVAVRLYFLCGRLWEGECTLLRARVWLLRER